MNTSTNQATDQPSSQPSSQSIKQVGSQVASSRHAQEGGGGDKYADVLIVGGGPAGLSFARAVADAGLNVTLIEKNPEDSIANPAYDGREIALTHQSKRTMLDLGMWQRIADDEKYLLKDASVTDGNSPYQLYFGKPKQVRGKAVESLGFLVSNHNIRKAACMAAKACTNVTLKCGMGVSQVRTDASGAYITLEDGSELSAGLLVVADSRFSASRRQLGISADMHDFGRTMIVCRMTHEVSNAARAVESFYYGRTLALLPLTDKLTNCVITVKSQQADEILAMSGEDFASYVARMLDGQFGKMQLVSTRHSYPLVGTHANRFHAPHAALIGDAAVGMHPVTAHGFNLGLQSVALLSKLVVQAASSGQNIAALSLLEKYERQHMLITRPMYHGTNAMVRLFTTDTPPAKALRSLVLRVSNNLPPLKALITKQLTG